MGKSASSRLGAGVAGGFYPPAGEGQEGPVWGGVAWGNHGLHRLHGFWESRLQAGVGVPANESVHQ